jgi:hypothetical protein
MVVLIGLVIIFKAKIVKVLEEIMKKIEDQSKGI